MRVLVATRERQGDEIYDFFWAEEGEMVFPPEACRRADCACGNAFAGIDSVRHTTTAKVVERPDLDREACIRLFQASAAGHHEGHDRATAVERVDIMRAIVSSAYLGAVVERQGERFRVRTKARASARARG
jgi:hypothetical protein